MSGAPYAVGQELWFESAVRYRTSGPVQVEKIGRKWVTLVGHHNGRFNLATGRLDTGGSGTSAGQVWLTREASEAARMRDKAWQQLVNRMRGHWRPPDGLTAEQIRQAETILFAASSPPLSDTERVS